MLPIAPGTWGSLPPVIVFGLMCWLGAASVAISVVMAAMVLAGCFVCVNFSDELVVATGKKDPGQIVADEFAGQAVVFMFLLEIPTEHKWIIITSLLGFALFRLFDIVKPWPVRKLEKLPDGWGILCDDLLAGVFAAIVLNVFVVLF